MKSALLKNSKTNSYKTVSRLFKNICSRHNSMTEICCALFKYENEKTSVLFVYLQLGHLLK